MRKSLPEQTLQKLYGLNATDHPTTSSELPKFTGKILFSKYLVKNTKTPTENMPYAYKLYLTSPQDVSKKLLTSAWDTYKQKEIKKKKLKIFSDPDIHTIHKPSTLLMQLECKQGHKLELVIKFIGQYPIIHSR